MSTYRSKLQWPEVKLLIAAMDNDKEGAKKILSKLEDRWLDSIETYINNIDNFLVSERWRRAHPED